MGIFHLVTPRGIFPFLGATKLHIHLKTSQYFSFVCHRMLQTVEEGGIYVEVSDKTGHTLSYVICNELGEVKVRITQEITDTIR